MHRFFVPGFANGEEALLPHDEAAHLGRVLRLKRGDTVAIFDGKGSEALARVESVASRRVSVTVLESRSPAAEAAVGVTLAQAVLKSDKMDRVIRDAVMLGVVAIQPVLTRRTDVPSGALKTGVRKERWDRTVVASVKQSGRAVVPSVLDPRLFGDVLAGSTGSRLMFVEPGSTVDAASVSIEKLEGHRPTAATVFIGPEGGWDPGELEDAAAAGVKLVTMGRRVLRADAAGAAALAVLRYVWRDL